MPTQLSLRIEGVKRGKGKVAGGFTLIELLAVIALVAILSVFAFTVVRSTREKSLAVGCAANLRQIGVALHLFAGEHRGMIPGRQYLPVGFNPAEGAQWFRWLVRKGYVKGMTINADLFYCPAGKPKSSTDFSVSNPLHAFYRYGMRVWAPPGSQSFDDTQLLPLNSIQKPSEFFLVADSYFSIEGTQGYQIFPGSVDWRVHLRHRKQANALFSDGRVAAMDAGYFTELNSRQGEYQANYVGRPFYVWPTE